MGSSGFWRMSAAQLLQGYARRDFSPVEVTREAVERIEASNARLRAFLVLDREGAMTAAKRAEALWLSPGEKPMLCGVPVSVKDTIEMAGLPTTYGSLAFKDNVQPDSEIVRRLRRAGAVILGKTNTPEFALRGATTNRLGASCANPWNLAHTSGGSSGGAAAGVAAGLGPLAVGTDSGGSIRQPAAYTGLFGLKPSLQRIPAVQVWRASPARSHNGPITRTVRDSALMMSALAGYDPRDADSRWDDADYAAFAAFNPRGKRVALSFTLGQPALEPEPHVRKLVEKAAALLTDLGCTVVPAEPPVIEGPDLLDDGTWAYAGDHFGAAEQLIPMFWEKHADDLTGYARPIYEKGRFALAWQYRKILRRNRAFNERMRNWFAAYDFLLCPLAGEAQTIADTDRPEYKIAMGFLSPFNHACNPAAAVPFGRSDKGLPLAVQLVGQLGDDIGVLGLSAAVEAAAPWAHEWPAFAEQL